MNPATHDINTPERDSVDFTYAMTSGKVAFAGAIACLSATGFATPGDTATTLIAVGRFEHGFDNSGGGDGGADPTTGKTKVRVRAGVFRYANSADADAITAAEIGDNCYIVDDQTVAKTNGGTTRSIAGRIVDVDDLGVWVALGFTVTNAPAGSLLAANNLSDVGSAATARANLGANKVYLQCRPISTKASDAAVVRVVAPVAGTITKIRSVSNEALAVGDATLTGKIGAAPITNGEITITQAGSAAGDVDSATPTAANAVVAGDVISITGGGASTATADADVEIEITY
ncbi:MAG: hypothetical protein WCA78_00650 [Rhizomicrobium sp.]